MTEDKLYVIKGGGEFRTEAYRLMDSFLVEGDKPRPIDRLNQDRHLFVENLLELIKQKAHLITVEELAKVVGKEINFMFEQDASAKGLAQAVYGFLKGVE